MFTACQNNDSYMVNPLTAKEMNALLNKPVDVYGANTPYGVNSSKSFNMIAIRRNNLEEGIVLYALVECSFTIFCMILKDI